MLKTPLTSNNNIPNNLKNTIEVFNLTQLLRLRSIINEKINRTNKMLTKIKN